MKTWINLMMISVAFIMQNCQYPINSHTIYFPMDLKVAICKNLTVPTIDYDTLVYEPLSSTLCGNSSKDEIDRYYLPNFDTVKYINLIAKNLHGVIWSYCLNSNHQETPVGNSIQHSWIDTNNLLLMFNGEVINRDSVIIYEQYRKGLQSVSITKLFTYQNGWQCCLLNTKKSIYKTRAK